MPGASHTLLRGVFAAALTALRGDSSIDHAASTAHYQRLFTEGCDGIAVFGTTGEANSFTVDERLALLDALADTDIPAKAFIGSGCCAAADTVRLTRKALEIGAAGVLMLPPFYYKDVSVDGLFASYASIIEQVGDAALRVYLYHFPKMAGIGLPFLIGVSGRANRTLRKTG